MHPLVKRPQSPRAPTVTAEPTTPTPAETMPGEEETTPTESAPTDSEPSARCLESWQQFGAIDDLQDSLAHVVLTLFACSNRIPFDSVRRR